MAKSSKPEFDWKKLNEYSTGAQDIYMALVSAIDNAKYAGFTREEVIYLVRQRYSR